MKKTFLALGTVLFLSPSIQAQTSGADLFKAKCASCHVSYRPSDISTLVAPPAMGVMRHVKMVYGTKDEALKFITEYTLNPDKNKSVCKDDKVKRFGLMPSQKGNVTEAELKTIASWMYENFGGQGKGYGENCKTKK